MSRIDHAKRNKTVRAAGNYAVAAPEKRKKRRRRKKGPDSFKAIRERRMKPGALQIEAEEFARNNPPATL